VKNLLYAISLANDGVVQPYVFFGHTVNGAVVEQFATLATIVRSAVLDRRTVPWFLHKVLFKSFGSQALVRRALRRYAIPIVSHAEHVYGSGLPFRVISWIPDFQYLHLPELFPTVDPAAETRRLQKVIAAADRIVLSSYAALEDFKRIAPAAAMNRVRVLQFVSQPNWTVQGADAAPTLGAMESKYGFQGPFFFLPNQFWQHKNHRVVFEALRLLRQRGREVLLLCTGNLRDYRLKDDGYAESLRRYISEHDLEKSIRILGLIEYGDVLSLMRHSRAVLNPSKFEGWSSTVEEARSLGKQLVLSNIAVHMEQNAPGARYFAPDDAEALASILSDLSTQPSQPWSAQIEAECRANLVRRTLAYGHAYLELVKEAASSSRGPGWKRTR
jgi:glycosyltransferase involved in cell wall biosynthesis